MTEKLACFSCPSSDAMREYPDNYYCFSCHMYQLKEGCTGSYQTNKTAKIIHAITPLKNIDKKPPYFHSLALKWLYGNRIHDTLIVKYNLAYDLDTKRVYIPNFKHKKLFGYQLRALSDFSTQKYLGAGAKLTYESIITHNLKEIDTEESLSEKGKETIKNSAIGLTKLPISFDVIICSPKKRSKPSKPNAIGTVNLA